MTKRPDVAASARAASAAVGYTFRANSWNALALRIRLAVGPPGIAPGTAAKARSSFNSTGSGER